MVNFLLYFAAFLRISSLVYGYEMVQHLGRIKRKDFSAFPVSQLSDADQYNFYSSPKSEDSKISSIGLLDGSNAKLPSLDRRPVFESGSADFGNDYGGTVFNGGSGSHRNMNNNLNFPSDDSMHVDLLPRYYPVSPYASNTFDDVASKSASNVQSILHLNGFDNLPLPNLVRQNSWPMPRNHVTTVRKSEEKFIRLPSAKGVLVPIPGNSKLNVSRYDNSALKRNDSNLQKYIGASPILSDGLSNSIDNNINNLNLKFHGIVSDSLNDAFHNRARDAAVDLDPNNVSDNDFDIIGSVHANLKTPKICGCSKLFKKYIDSSGKYESSSEDEESESSSENVQSESSSGYDKSESSSGYDKYESSSESIEDNLYNHDDVSLHYNGENNLGKPNSGMDRSKWSSEEDSEKAFPRNLGLLFLLSGNLKGNATPSDTLNAASFMPNDQHRIESVFDSKNRSEMSNIYSEEPNFMFYPSKKSHSSLKNVRYSRLLPSIMSVFSSKEIDLDEQDDADLPLPLTLLVGDQPDSKLVKSSLGSYSPVIDENGESNEDIDSIEGSEPIIDDSSSKFEDYFSWIVPREPSHISLKEESDFNDRNRVKVLSDLNKNYGDFRYPISEASTEKYPNEYPKLVKSSLGSYSTVIDENGESNEDIDRREGSEPIIDDSSSKFEDYFSWNLPRKPSHISLKESDFNDRHRVKVLSDLNKNYGDFHHPISDASTKKYPNDIGLIVHRLGK